MASPIAISALGAFQAAFSVLLTLCYGVLAARLDMIDARTARNVSSLCVNMFLPALIVTKVGSQISAPNLTNYIPVFIWAIVYGAVSMIFGKIASKVLKLPSWVALACAFNNTTSLPLLLTKSLTSTGILSFIAGSDVADAVERAQSYFLINSMVAKAATFAIGPKLLGPDIKEEEVDQEANGQQSSHEEADESTSLLPKPITTCIAAAEDSASTQFHRLPHYLQRGFSFVRSLLNPPLWGAILAVVIGLTPPLHKVFFAKTIHGGWLNAWFTSSLRNLGDLFTALQMLVVGSKLSDSLTPPRGAPNPNPPIMAIVVIFTIRFVFWGIASVPIVYFLASKTQVLGGDPMLWWSMMLMPVGPPAMIISSLVEVAGVGQTGKMMVARTLSYAYTVSPIMFLPVVAATKACEMVLDQRGQKPSPSHP
ncbi:auxin efflux carrier [Sphaerosporella brunnea]|uniref:Auxin efflux carrier n=1 Tax=Sphaerosporella brunnea TaxID=1250544 RepID=A0A5J5F8F1_9PEZI|nr:auxin efflux carrier [Sphaerosporella brunnea]